ncbi:cellulose biosynthesis protein BcsN [Starkeya koreensis]|uniref:Cellulose biosynthesis protein BcsN n=1 Tax=Ancylobacter koreensis TaxID=266121 RepID=A0ABT0DL42_9HYPH|nr:cellulose biosynthesis protein BcsN [Ancylobacter koreensis]MCK0208006.1 cellulose biosynthesis protein BcsN [Ancylobacter koreensis]
MYPLQMPWSGGQDPKVASLSSEVEVSDALVLPEPGSTPPVIAVVQTNFLNAIEQEIVLGTNSHSRGQNALYVVFFGPVPGRTGWENTRADDFLNTEVIDQEMLDRMPGVTMYTSNYFVQNRYGPFNYAIGNAGGGELCIYGWQRIQSQVPMFLTFRDRGSMSIRLRLCQIGATEQDLLRVMYRYSINAYFLPHVWQPYGRPLGEPEGIGRIGGPLAYPSGLQGDGTVLDGWMGSDVTGSVPPAAEAAPVAAPRRARPRYGSQVPQAETVYQGGGYGAPRGNLVDPYEGYPQVPGPAGSAQLAPSTQPSVVQGRPPAGAVVDQAPARPVNSPAQNSPFSAPPTLPGVTPMGGSRSSVGDPVRLVPGASSYPAPAQ